jgi:hypothetical protein
MHDGGIHEGSHISWMFSVLKELMVIYVSVNQYTYTPYTKNLPTALNTTPLTLEPPKQDLHANQNKFPEVK